MKEEADCNIEIHNIYVVYRLLLKEHTLFRSHLPTSTLSIVS